MDAEVGLRVFKCPELCRYRKEAFDVVLVNMQGRKRSAFTQIHQIGPTCYSLNQLDLPF